MAVLDHFGLRGLRCFVIESSLSNQVLIEVVLQRLGLELVFANSSAPLLEQLKQFGMVDIIILDFPQGGQGFETLQQLRSLPAYAETIIIAMSAMPVEAILPLLEDFAYTAFLKKPLNYEGLGRRLLRLLQAKDFLTHRHLRK